MKRRTVFDASRTRALVGSAVTGLDEGIATTYRDWVAAGTPG